MELHKKGWELQRLVPRLLLLVALLAALVAYRPGLNGPFVFDDGINVVNNQHLRLSEFSRNSLNEVVFSISNGQFRRPLAMLSFAFDFYLDRNKAEPFLSAFTFKVTNLVIHLLNGIAVYFLTYLLVALYRERRQAELSPVYPAWLALAVSAAWLLHPLNLTSVLYVVQRMASLAALFSFTGLSVYLLGRARLDNGQRGGRAAILVCLLIFAPLALFSKENGILLPFLMLVVEVFLFRFETRQPSARRFLIVFFGVFVVLPALVLSGYLAFHSDLLLAGYARRDFVWEERLMTEARVVWFYLYQIILPNTAAMGIYHDDFIISHSVLDPLTTLPAILGILALVTGVWFWRQRAPLVAFGICFFLVGHSLESSIIPLELVHEHRNYLPMYGILLAFFHLLLNPLLAVTTRLPRRVLGVLLIPLFAAGTFSRASDWSGAESLWAAEVRHHPESRRANTAMGDYYANALSFDPLVKESNYQLARQAYENNTALDRYDIGALFGLLRLCELYAKPVEKIWIADLVHGLQSSSIPANTNEYLVVLASCLTHAGCPLQLSEVDQVIRAPLSNSKVVGSDKALILYALTYYLVNVRHDYVAADVAIRQAIALNPQDINLQLWLVTVLIASNRMAEARQQIDFIKMIDTRNMRAKDVALLEEQLTHGR